MTKPAVTLKSVKTTPLTQAELDTNFTNLRDATISLTADTGGTAVVADLNGNITLVAGSGVTLTGDNSAKTITIDAGAANLTGNNLRFGANDTAEVIFNPPVGYDSKDLVIAFDSVKIDSPTGANILKFAGTDLSISGDGAGAALLEFDTDRINLITANTAIRLGSGFSSTTNIQISGVLTVDNLTTTERNALVGVLAGAIVFNTTTSKFQGYDGTTWVDLN